MYLGACGSSIATEDDLCQAIHSFCEYLSSSVVSVSGQVTSMSTEDEFLVSVAQTGGEITSGFLLGVGRFSHFSVVSTSIIACCTMRFDAANTSDTVLESASPALGFQLFLFCAEIWLL